MGLTRWIAGPLMGILGAGCSLNPPGPEDCAAHLTCAAPSEGGADGGLPFQSEASTNDSLPSEAADASSIDVLRSEAGTTVDDTGAGAIPCDGARAIMCSGMCVDPDSPAHCGSCTNACDQPEGGQATCTQGQCGIQCAPSLLNCSGACVDPASPAHCGSCTNACPAPASMHGQASCGPAPDGGESCGVSCSSGYHACAGDCWSNADAPSNLADPCILSPTFGVFVSPNGNDGNVGTMASPMASLGRAIDAARAGGKSVFACGGTYRQENLLVDSSRDGILVYGGLDCSVMPWIYTANMRAVVAPSAPGYALEARGLIAGVTFEDFAFEATDASAADGSSIAVVVSNSSNVVLRRCSIRAGAGAAGQDATPPAPNGTQAPDGRASSLLAGGPSTSNPQCPTSIGGAGAPATRGMGASGASGQPGLPNGGTPANCSNLVVDNTGANGGPGAIGAGASTWGALSPAGWSPTGGGLGGNGAVGQGGGGGASIGGFTPGAGGAPGGCGGVGGAAGPGGGSSIAVLSYGSSISLDSFVLQTGPAGRGGNGAAGQGGQVPGAGGTGTGQCPGGAGGMGGTGGAGGGGAGGLSAGVVWSGPSTMGPTLNGVHVASAPTLTGVVLDVPGAGGIGAASSNGGKSGVAQAVLQVP